MEKKQSRSQAIAIMITATALLLFVASAFQYKDQPFFNVLLITRIIMVAGGYAIAVGLLLGKIKLVKMETYYFLFCLMMQALHGFLEGSTSTAFYSFIGPWLILCSLSLQETFGSWFKKTFPFQMLGFLLPLIFKDSKYFASIGTFVDVFSLPVSGLVVGLILAKITSDRYAAIADKLQLEKKLNEALSENLNNEKEIRSRVEVELEKAKLEIEKTAELRATSELAAQVSHDIRSPLAALNMLLNQLDSLPETQRVLTRSSVNRINDIANSLLNKGKKIHSGPSVTEEVEEVLLASLVDSIVSEKRLQLREQGNITLEASLQNGYGLFVKVNPGQLKRTISNAINNSSEAMGQVKGQIDVLVEQIGTQVNLTIKDNGKGIPKHVLEKLGQKGVTFGKEGTNSGSGLGVYHAMQTIEGFGGTYRIESTEGHGASVIITLPLAEPPPWFVKQIVIPENCTIVASDDDVSILEIWNQRFSPWINAKSASLKTCTSGACLREWIAKNPLNSATALYLIDYEFLGSKQSGLDLIEELGIAQNAILVTSRYEEAKIKERFIKMGIKVIPKGMAPIVPIVEYVEEKKLDGVVIDNDPLIELVWNMAAKERGRSVLVFADEDAFMAKKSVIPVTTPIYVDVSLGDGVKGQDVAQRINSLGFTEIHLATGYQADSIEYPDFIKSVVGKDFPFA